MFFNEIWNYTPNISQLPTKEVREKKQIYFETDLLLKCKYVDKVILEINPGTI